MPPLQPIPWKYPSGFYCQKCQNTGYKPNGKSCKKCWERFAHNNVSYVPSPAIQQPGLRIPFTNYRINDDLGLSTNNSGYASVFIPPAPPAPPIAPLQPTGRLPEQPPSYSEYQKVPQAPPMQTLYNRPPLPPAPAPLQPVGIPMPPRVVRPGDPSMGGVLCGRCRGSGIIGNWILGEDTCTVCGGAGRVFS